LAPAIFAVIYLFLEYQLPLTLGVIANVTGYVNTYNMPAFLNQTLTSGLIQIADHGYNHEYFTLYTLEQQINLLQWSQSRIYNLIGVNTTMFVPPYNAIDGNTTLALIATGYTFMSA